MKKSIKYISSVVLLFIIVAIIVTNKSTDILKIGVILPLSGESSSLGEKIKRGIDLAIGESNSENKFDFIYEDGGMTPRSALNAYQKLTNIDKVSVFIGPFGPDQIMSLAPVLKDEQIVLGVSLCEDRFIKYVQIFCTYPAISDQIKSGITTIQKNNLKSIAIVVPKGILGDAVRGELEKYQSDSGYKIVATENIQQGEKDFRSIITKIKSYKTDGVYIASLPEEGYRLIKQFRELEYKGHILAEVDFDENILKDYGNIAEGIYLPGHISPEFEKSFSERYRLIYKEEPDMYAALGHSIASSILKSFSGRDFKKDRLFNQENTRTAIIDFRFKDDRTVSIPVETLIFKDQKIQRLK